jgi:hypothetical protein
LAVTGFELVTANAVILSAGQFIALLIKERRTNVDTFN